MIGGTTTGNHRTSPLMSLNPLAPAFLPQYQSSSDPHISVCNSTTMSLPLAHFFCGMPPQIIPPHAPSINQHITDGTFLLPLLQPTDQSKADAADHQPTAGSSALLSSPLQHQANCVQAIHKTIQQFNHYLEAEHLVRQILQLIVFQQQKYFVLLRYLLFSPVETISDKDTAFEISATSPLFHPNSNPNPNPNSTLSVFPLPVPVEPKLRRSTRLALWDHPERKKPFCKCQFPAHTQHAGSSCNHGPELHIKNLKTRKIICRWNGNLYI